MTGREIKVPEFVIDKKTGKPKRIWRFAAGQRSNKFAKAARQARAWEKANGKV